MKKKLAMSLAAIMLLLSACGGPTPGGQSSSSAGQVDASVSSPAPTQPASGNAVQFDPTATIEETMLVDESDIKITATGLKYTAYDVKLSLTIENNSNQDLSFYSGTSGYNCNSINGYMIDGGYLNADIAAGKKANETVSFSVDQLTLFGLSEIADIELGFNITDSNYDDYLQTGPRQLKTSAADSYDYETDTYRQAIENHVLENALGFTLDCDSEEIVFDQKGVRVVSQVLTTNTSGEQALLVEVENTTSDTVYTSVGNISLNGLGIQSGTWSTDWISGGKRRIIAMNLSNMLDESYRSAFGLENIGQVAYTFEPKDSDRDTLVVPQTLTLTVPGGSASYDGSGEELYQEDGIHIVSKGLAPDSFELSDDIHLLLLVENGTNQALTFDVDYDSVSVNGFMTDFICYSKTVVPGGSDVLDVELMGSSLEENGTAELESITDVELTVEAKNDSYKTIAKPVVTAKGN
jgi:hypothetical protein